MYDYSKELTVYSHENNLDTVALLANTDGRNSKLFEVPPYSVSHSAAIQGLSITTRNADVLRVGGERPCSEKHRAA